jgi:hypothetical protein
MLRGSRTPPMAEDRTLRRRRMRTRRKRGTRRGKRGSMRGRRGTMMVRGYTTRRWGVTGLLQDPHPHTDLELASSFALL